jgi:tetratricopeptide (TPR) repeat protein
MRALSAATQLLISRCDDFLIRGDLQAALDTADAAVRADPNNANAHYVRGGILGLAGQLDLAWLATREALRLNPTHAGAFSNLGAIATWRQEYAQAVSYYQRALELQADIQDASTGLAYALLSMGEFEQGWAQHERSRPLGVLAYDKKEPVLWNGSAMPEGTLTLFCEGGLGDVLQFCRLIALVKSRVRKVALYLQPYYQPLAGVLSTLSGVDEITADPACLRHSDASLSVLSLPYVLKSTLAAATPPVPYLHAQRALSEQWAGRLRGDRGPRVGLVWGGNPRLARARVSALDRRRSVPLSLLAPLLAVPEVSFYSIQKGAAAQQLAGSPLASRLVDPTADIADLADTAALIDQLDLVVTVDTSVAHLAGAMGKPVWMLNRYDSCWRWGPHREDAPWYPTLRIFRQAAFGEWAPVVDRAADELRAWAAGLTARDRQDPEIRRGAATF